ncbi:glycosyltransferase [Candidatus Pelagibacter sp.]|nr:glycosyltransferase [Candidatus Pelagibacter sp.]
MVKLKRVIWLQSIYNEKILRESKAISPASNLWQNNFLKNLKKQKIEIFTIGHYFEPAWPKGQLFINTKKTDLVKDYDFKIINYINLPFLRNIFLFFKYIKILTFLKFKKGDLVLAYNRSVVTNVMKIINKIRSIPFVVVIADLKYPKKSNGYVFLSWRYFKEIKIKEPKYFLDGGINEISNKKNKKIKNKKNKIILYSGTIGGHTGLEILIKAFKKIKLNNLELWICGQGNDKKIESLLKEDKRIKFFGFVSNSKLIKICSQADIFVNPRPININQYNFPSKLLFYLNFKKPIISTRCGLNPKYDKVIYFLKNDKIKNLKIKIENLVLINKRDLLLLEKKIKRFNNYNSWKFQTKKFIIWLNKNFSF